MRAERLGQLLPAYAAVVTAWLSALCCALGTPVSPENTDTPSAPFLRLRESTLGYHGMDVDFTNLTEIRIGWFGPTNSNDPLTGDLWWAANLAVREANIGGGLSGLPFRLIPRWAVDPWGTGVSQLARMVYDERPLALLGSVDSATTHLAEQVVAKANLPLVSPIATDKSVTLAGVAWMFSCAPSDEVIARVLVDNVLALSHGNAIRDGVSAECRSAETRTGDLRRSAETPPRLALLSCIDHESRMTAREVSRELSRRGRAPDFRFDVPPGAHAIAQQLSALEASQPAAILVIAGVEDSARFVRAIRACFPGAPASLPDRSNAPQLAGKDEGASSPVLFGTHSMSRARFRELAGSAAEGIRFPLLFVPDSADTNATRFLDLFTSERDRPPDHTAALTYDATRLLIEAIRRAGPNRARVREALTQLSSWPGIAGFIRFDGTGQNTRTNISMGTIRDGAVVPLTAPPGLTQTSSKSSTP